VPALANQQADATAPNPCSALVRQCYEERAADLKPIIADLRATGASSLRQIAAGLNKRGILRLAVELGPPCR